MNGINRVDVGKHVCVSINGEIKDLELVLANIQNMPEDKVAVDSPLGLTLIYKLVGDKLESVPRVGKRVVVEILNIN
jgi:transcription elongation GreA/GreB family factor